MFLFFKKRRKKYLEHQVALSRLRAVLLMTRELVDLTMPRTETVSHLFKRCSEQPQYSCLSSLEIRKEIEAIF